MPAVEYVAQEKQQPTLRQQMTGILDRLWAEEITPTFFDLGEIEEGLYLHIDDDRRILGIEAIAYAYSASFRRIIASLLNAQVIGGKMDCRSNEMAFEAFWSVPGQPDATQIGTAIEYAEQVLRKMQDAMTELDEDVPAQFLSIRQATPGVGCYNTSWIQEAALWLAAQGCGVWIEPNQHSLAYSTKGAPNNPKVLRVSPDGCWASVQTAFGEIGDFGGTELQPLADRWNADHYCGRATKPAASKGLVFSHGWPLEDGFNPSGLLANLRLFNGAVRAFGEMVLETEQKMNCATWAAERAAIQSVEEEAFAEMMDRLYNGP